MGLALAICVALALGSHAGLSPGVILLMAVAGALASYLVLIATIVAIGGERWVFYHHALAVAGAVVVLLVALKRPLLPYLDVCSVGLLLLLACGRGGCFLVGCCHGQPADWGVTYGPEHVAGGFPRDLAGVRLAPVQAIEGLWVIFVAAIGSRMIWRSAVAGAAFSWCLIAYGGGRSLLEFWRGDRDRRSRWGLSEAQWTSLVLMVVAIAFQVLGWLPRIAWQLELALGSGVATAVFWIQQSRRPRVRRLLRPNHIREMALALDRVRAGNRMSVEETSLGVRISGAAFAGPEAPRCVYTLSSGVSEMDADSARVLGDLIRRLRHREDQIKVVGRQRGIFHLLVHSH